MDVNYRNEDELLNMQAHLLNLSNEAIFAWDLNGTIIYWNKGAHNNYGYSSSEAVGRVSQILLKTVYPSEIDDISLVLARDGEWKGEIEHTCKDGKKIIIESSQQVILNDLGQQIVLETNRDITERKEAELELIGLNNRLSLALKSVGGAAWEVDMLSGIIIWSPQLYEMHGIDASEIITLEKSMSFVYPEDRQKIANLLDTTNKSKIEFGHSEHRIINLKSGIMWISAASRNVFDDSGKLVYLYGVNIDITHRKKLEMSLERKILELQTVLDAVPAAVWLSHDSKCREIWGNFTSHQILNLSANVNTLKSAREGQVIDTQVQDAFDMYKDGIKMLPEEMPVHRAAKGDAMVNFEFDIIFKDGMKRNMLGNAVPFLNKKGRPNGSVAAFIDITERKKIEESLSESEKRYRLLYETMIQGVVYQDTSGTIISMNPAAEKVLGWNSEDYIGSFPHDLERFTIREDGTRFPANEHPSMVSRRTGKEIHDVVMGVYNPKVKEYCWINISSVPICQEGEKKACNVYSVFSDITDRVKSEKRLLKQQQEIINAEKERNEALEKVIEMKDEFVSTISHEFRTPLTVINSALQMMEFYKSKQEYEKAIKYTDNIKRNVFRQMRLVNNLLEISSGNNNYFKINKGNYDIVFLTNSICNSVSEYVTHKGVQLNFHTSIEKCVIGVDEEKYERILLNLLSNAIKFTPEGKAIYVNIFEEDHRICIQVKDEGPGIPKDKQLHVFERFGQVDSSLTREAEGTGIGLSIVKLLIDNLDGELFLKSEEGDGCTFTVHLPKTLVNENEKEAEQSHLSKKKGSHQFVQMIDIEFSDIY